MWTIQWYITLSPSEIWWEWPYKTTTCILIQFVHSNMYLNILPSNHIGWTKLDQTWEG